MPLEMRVRQTPWQERFDLYQYPNPPSRVDRKDPICPGREMSYLLTAPATLPTAATDMDAIA
ncbi:hypothetical protein MLPF_2366 [Mycobacterium lepromatosis]|nr:hypothetical protein MLPF_2366 [Mycobacterium lepromatosis]